MLQMINFREKIPPKRRQENRPLVSRGLVGGKVVVENAVYNGIKAGKVLV